jgi:hypothetical protein
MPLLVISGGDVAAAFRIDVAAAISMVIAAVMIGLVSPSCLGRSRAAAASAVLLFTANATLGSAAEPVTFLAIWQLQWFLAWSIGLFFGDDDVQSWLGRMLAAGWLIDAVLIAGALFAIGQPADVARVPSPILMWGLVISLAGRVGALPIGAHRLWGDRSPGSAASWMLLACLPPACVAVLRTIEALEVDSASRLGFSEFLLITAMAAAFCSLRQELPARETAWRLAAGLCGAAAIAFALPPWPGRLMWILAAVIAVAGSKRLAAVSPPRRQFSTSADLLGRLESAAADEWRLPQLWRFGITMPLRGASQVLRFLDGLLFEQLPAQAGRRISASASPALGAVPDAIRGLVAPALVATAIAVLLVLSFR